MLRVKNNSEQWASNLRKKKKEERKKWRNWMKSRNMKECSLEEYNSFFKKKRILLLIYFVYFFCFFFKDFVKFKNKLRTIEPRFWEKIKNNRASFWKTWFLFKKKSVAHRYTWHLFFVMLFLNSLLSYDGHLKVERRKLMLEMPMLRLDPYTKITLKSFLEEDFYILFQLLKKINFSIPKTRFNVFTLS